MKILIIEEATYTLMKLAISVLNYYFSPLQPWQKQWMLHLEFAIKIC